MPSQSVKDYLQVSGYASVEEWAEDSDMTLEDGVWYDEDGNEVDPEEYLEELIAELDL